jgi:hypothetical protein
MRVISMPCRRAMAMTSRTVPSSVGPLTLSCEAGADSSVVSPSGESCKSSDRARASAASMISCCQGPLPKCGFCSGVARSRPSSIQSQLPPRALASALLLVVQSTMAPRAVWRSKACSTEALASKVVSGSCSAKNVADSCESAMAKATLRVSRAPSARGA